VFDEGGFEAVVALFDSTITFHAQYQQRRDIPPCSTCWCWTATTRARWAGWRRRCAAGWRGWKAARPARCPASR
jgi:hypothetical protein